VLCLSSAEYEHRKSHVPTHHHGRFTETPESAPSGVWPHRVVHYQVNYHAAVTFSAYVRRLSQYRSPASKGEPPFLGSGRK